MTQTMLKLLRRAAESRSARVCTVSGYYTGRKNPSRFGRRECDAACKLRDAGLLTFVRHHTSYETNLSGSAVHFTETVWSITEAGRKAVEPK